MDVDEYDGSDYDDEDDYDNELDEKSVYARPSHNLSAKKRPKVEIGLGGK